MLLCCSFLQGRVQNRKASISNTHELTSENLKQQTPDQRRKEHLEQLNNFLLHEIHRQIVQKFRVADINYFIKNEIK